MSLVALGVALFAAEVVLRVTGFGPLEIQRREWHPHASEIFEPLPGLPAARHRPNVKAQQIYYTCRRGTCAEDRRIPFDLNSHGHRGAEYSLKKPAGTLRLLFLGDSFTVGDGARVEETWPQLIGAMLRERLGEGQPVEIINTAVVAYSTFDEWMSLKRWGLEFEPDLVIVGFFLNDIRWDSSQQAVGFQRSGEEESRGEESRGPEGRGPGRRGQGRRGPPDGQGGPRSAPISNVLPETRWDHPIRLWRFVLASRAALAARPMTVQVYRDYWDPQNRRSQGLFAEALDGMSALQKARDLPFLFVVWPWLNTLDEDYPFFDIHETIERECSSRGLRTLPLLDAFLKMDDDTPLWIHESDHHPSVELHRLAAELTVDRLLSDPAFGLTELTPTRPAAP